MAAGTRVSLTGTVSGMPIVNQPLFTSFVQPVMDAAVTGGIGTITGFGAVPSNGVLGGQPLAGAALTGTFTATTAGTGAVTVALDSEQVPCPITVSAAPVPPTTPPTVAPPTEPPTVAPPPPGPSVAPTMAGTLPPTGSTSYPPLYVGIVVVALGLLAVAITTRRRTNRT